MTHRPGFIALATASALLFAAFGATPAAFAQNSPGVADGFLTEEFQLNKHPDMPFAKKPDDKKFQNKVTKDRKLGDDGDPDGCNLQCPDSE